MARKQINANIEEEKWAKFMEICKAEHQTCNKVLADYIDKVVASNSTELSEPQLQETLLLKLREKDDELLEKRLQLLETKVSYLEKAK